MTRYTVTCTRDAQDGLARLWLAATDRIAVANAADTIERELRDDPTVKGKAAPDGFRQLIVLPLSALFAVSKDDRVVTIWSFDLSQGQSTAP